MMELIIKNAEPGGFGIALDLLRKASIWLREKNIDYWQNWHDPPAAHVDWIKQGFDNKEFYFVYNNKEHLIGMYRLQFSDEIFWGNKKDKAGYLHSFTTNRELKGRGIGGFILSAIEKELSSKGFDYLRLIAGRMQ